MSTSTNDLTKSKRHSLTLMKEIVEQTIQEEKLMVDNLLHEPKEVLTKGQSISDKVASFGGSWKFIIIFSIILFFWILFNTLTPLRDKFDPYPFILMNLVLSCIAALQAPIIMMSQNRQEEKDRKRSENDFMINMKAELEIRSLHQKIDLLLEDQIKTLFDSHARQLELLKNIEKELKKS